MKLSIKTAMSVAVVMLFGAAASEASIQYAAPMARTPQGMALLSTLCSSQASPIGLSDDLTFAAGLFVILSGNGANTKSENWGEIVAFDTDLQSTYDEKVGSWAGSVYRPERVHYQPGPSYPVVPEPSTYLAGALLLIPFTAGTLRVLRKRQVA